MKKLLSLFAFILALGVSVFAQDNSPTSRAVVVGVSNASSTGTTLRRLAKLTGAPSTAVVVATTDTDGAIGVVISRAGTSGVAAVQVAGQVLCEFDGATTAGNYVQISSSTAGKCHDAGSSSPTSGQVIGRVMTTNLSAGTYNVLLSLGAKGAGNVQGAASSTDNSVVRFDGAGGKTIQNSLVTIDDSGSVNIPSGQTYKINSVALAKGDVGLGNVDNTSDATKNAASVTLTNKTFSLGSNTVSGTTAQFNTALSDNDFATLAGSETLTNKTLTTPTIGSFTNATHNHTNAAGGGQLTISAFSSTTGSGAVVGATSPTITTPTIASFANANHDHSNSAGGGTLSITALPLVYDKDGVLQSGAHIVTGFSIGSGTVTFSGSAVFTATSNYQCTGANFSQPNSFRITKDSGTQITVTATGAEVIMFMCIGN